MEKRSTTIAGLTQLLDASGRPVYAVDGERRLVYCNPSLASWLGMERSQIVGRYVEYHSVTAEDETPRQPMGLLTELCPPPAALAGTQCFGTVATVARDGRLIHRHADFLPLTIDEPSRSTKDGGNGIAGGRTGVFVLLASADMSSQELSLELSAEPTPDELHRIIRRFRHSQAEQYAVDTLVGTSSGIERVRAQVSAAAASRAHVLIRGRRQSGRAHVARSIFYQLADAQSSTRLIPLHCAMATENLLRRALDSVGKRATADNSTLLLLDLEQLLLELQPQLLAALRDASFSARVIATVAVGSSKADDNSSAVETASLPLDQKLLDAISTITIDVPALADRLEDLPFVTQCFLESCNKGSAKQVGSVRADALDLLALYCWPGELDELRAVIAAAHAAAISHEIMPADLPPVIHHAAKAAAIPRRQPPEKIVLDDLLASIEREVIERALAQVGGNKSAAAELLGMTRPRLYRRLVQLGLASESAIEFHEDTSE
jgi:DNA-binding NtrC family response regulator